MRWRWGPAETVLALSAGLVVLIFAIFGLLVWQASNQVIADAETKAQFAAEVVTEEARWLVGSAQLVLTRVDYTLQGDPTAVDDAKLAAFNDALKVLPATMTLTLADAQGRGIGPGASQGPSAAAVDEDVLKALQSGKEWVIAPGSFAGPGHAGTFVVAKRMATNGAFRGVAQLTIDNGALATFWAPLNMGPDSTVSIARDDGQVVTRFPPLQQALDLSTLAVFKTLTASDRGAYFSPSSPADGVARLVAFQHIPGLGLIALTSISQQVVLEPVWASTRVVLLLLAPIAIALFLGSMLTARLLRRSEQTRRELEDAFAHNQVLFREIHHRVKNNLQSVASLVQLQPISPDIKMAMNRRIAAMSAVHEHIYRSDKFGTVQVKGYLETLIAYFRESLGTAADIEERIDDDLTIDVDSAVPLGLAVNEVVSNAFKHAFADGRPGKIAIIVRRGEDNTAILTIEDDGIGFDPDSASSGMGRRLIAALSQQLGGSPVVESRPGLSRFSISFALAEKTVPGPTTNR